MSLSVAQLNATAQQEFIVREGSNEVLRLDDEGDMWLNGKLYENVVGCLDTIVYVVGLRIRNPQGDTVAVVNAESFCSSLLEPQSPHTVPAGSMILKGRAFIGGDPDRAASQGN